jgi:putative transposase
MHNVRQEQIMTRPLDGIALQTYFRRLKLEKDAQDLLIHIRSSPPSRLPDSRAGNMPIWYPSKKMQCIMKAESAKVEFAFLLEAEHDNDVLEFWDQPPPIELIYRDRRGHLQQPLHTPITLSFATNRQAGKNANPLKN